MSLLFNIQCEILNNVREESRIKEEEGERRKKKSGGEKQFWQAAVNRELVEGGYSVETLSNDNREQD